MAWPRATDYCEAVQNLRVSMVDEELREGRLECTSLGLPMLWAGNFADVYKVHCPATGNTWALKCFTREVRGLQERYRTIAAHLDQVRLPFTVDFQYLDRGIRVGGQAYPMLKMRWVEGLSLTQFVEEHLERPRNLKMLLDLWVRLAARLREARVAHADLQHGNVLLVPVSGNSLALRLIDYDGMYVPPLAGTRSGELGHPAYQHPDRLSKGIYNAEVDRFSHLTIYGAVRSLMVGRRELWDHFNNGDNLLFRESDFHSPERSTLFRAIWDLGDADARAIAGRLVLACLRPLEAAPLLEEVVTDGGVKPLDRGDQAAVESILRWSAVRVQGIGGRGQGSGVRGSGPEISTPGPAGALITDPQSPISGVAGLHAEPVLADVVEEPPVVAPPVALQPAASLPFPPFSPPTPVVAPPVVAPAALETICQQVLAEEPVAAPPLTADELTLPGNDWWSFIAPPAPGASPVGVLMGVGRPGAAGLVEQAPLAQRVGMLLRRTNQRLLAALGRMAAWPVLAARQLRRLLRALDRPLAALAGEGNTILHGFLRCLTGIALGLLLVLCGRMAWSYWVAAAWYRSMTWQIVASPSPAGAVGEMHGRDWGLGIGDGDAGTGAQNPDDPPPTPNPQSAAASPAEQKELRLRPIAPQTVAAGQQLTVPVMVEDAGYWKGKVRFSLAGDLPPGATLDPATGLFAWTPPEDIGPETCYCFVWADSPDGKWDVRMLGITVRPGQPDRPLRLEPIGPKTVRAGGIVKFSAAIEDAAYWAGRGKIEFRCEPAGRYDLRRGAPILDQPTGTFTWSPPVFQRPGDYEFAMSVSGPLHASDRCWFTIRVLGPAAPPGRGRPVR